MRQKLKRRWGCRQELAQIERELSNSSVVCFHPSTSSMLRHRCHPAGRQQEAGRNLVLFCSVTLHNCSLKPKGFWSKHLKCVDEERAGGRAEYFLRPWSGGLWNFEIEILQGTWKSMGKEYMPSISWPGHGAQQYLRQGWQQMFANTCILKHSLTTVAYTKSWECNSTAGFRWLNVFPAIFKKCWK